MSQPQDDPEIAARMKAHREAQRKASTEGMTVAQRLLRAAALRTTTIRIPDSTEEGIGIEVYVPTRTDLDTILKLTADIQKAARRGDGAQERQLTDDLYQMFAGLCVDPSLDIEFWRAGNYSMGEFLALQDGLFETALTLRDEARRFRTQSRR
jgi:hypothetical protein